MLTTVQQQLQVTPRVKMVVPTQKSLWAHAQNFAEDHDMHTYIYNLIIIKKQRLS